MIVDISWISVEVISIITVAISSLIVIIIDTKRKKKQVKIETLKMALRPTYPSVKEIFEDTNYAIKLRTRSAPDKGQLKRLQTNLEKNILCIKQDYSEFIENGTELNLKSVAPVIAAMMVCVYIDEDYHNLLLNQNKLDQYVDFISKFHEELKKILLK
ncbi:MAG: hypothetical protein NWE89_12970 [Candidatus Bathyarchaeota archaeon]|nr:hypothetical protein [Candidatus Bathyarchaeota archaeon]